MSKGTSCKCPEKAKPLTLRDWSVWQYKHNRSAFNGYRVTRSDYSQIRCNNCNTTWRTKAPYVTDLYYNGVNHGS